MNWLVSGAVGLSLCADPCFSPLDTAAALSATNFLKHFLLPNFNLPSAIIL